MQNVSWLPPGVLYKKVQTVASSCLLHSILKALMKEEMRRITIKHREIPWWWLLGLLVLQILNLYSIILMVLKQRWGLYVNISTLISKTFFIARTGASGFNSMSVICLLGLLFGPKNMGVSDRIKHSKSTFSLALSGTKMSAWEFDLPVLWELFLLK